MYCIRGNSRQTGKKEIIKGGFQTKEQAEQYLKDMAKVYFRTHTYARVAKEK